MSKDDINRILQHLGTVDGDLSDLGQKLVELATRHDTQHKFMMEKIGKIEKAVDEFKTLAAQLSVIKAIGYLLAGFMLAGIMTMVTVYFNQQNILQKVQEFELFKESVLHKNPDYRY